MDPIPLPTFKIAKANVERRREGKCQVNDYGYYSLKEASDIAKANVERHREGKCQGNYYDCYSLKEASDIAKANVKAPTTTATR